MSLSKQQIAFYRKLYLACLIDSEAHSVPSLEEKTGMPRRTIQDCIKVLPDIGITCEFVRREGGRNNEGFYRLVDWGPIRQEWVAKNLESIKSALGL